MAVVEKVLEENQTEMMVDRLAHQGAKALVNLGTSTKKWSMKL